MFAESISFPLIEPLDNLYLLGGQVIWFVDELVDLVFKRFYLDLFLWDFGIIKVFYECCKSI